MRVKFANKTSTKRVKRLKNKAKIRKKVTGTGERPRLTVFRSARHLYAQLIDDATGKTLLSVSTLKGDAKGKKTEMAKQIGAQLAKEALSKNIKNVVFDRGGFLYHGRIKAIADGAREAGLNF
ncbi:MAG: 50S ribosomal protein L18 [Bdellovibrionales bacterium]